MAHYAHKSQHHPGIFYRFDTAFRVLSRLAVGSLAAGVESMGLLGCCIIGFVAALGGGTVRDVLLGRAAPIWWLVAWDEASHRRIAQSKYSCSIGYVPYSL